MRKVICSEPFIGMERSRTRFLWMPLTLPRWPDGKHEKRWLEFADVTEMFQIVHSIEPAPPPAGMQNITEYKWVPIGWSPSYER